jgi:fermentation-respiration switch protein FrsA (DUF1100 family)
LPFWRPLRDAPVSPYSLPDHAILASDDRRNNPGMGEHMAFVEQRRQRRPATLLAAGALVASLSGAGWIAAPSGEAIRVLADIDAGPAPTELKAMTPPPSRHTLTVDTASSRWQADLYEPRVPARASMLLVPGLSPSGKDDPRLVAFANTLGRAGFTVLVPQPPNHRTLRVSADNATLVSEAVDWFTSHSPDLPLGIFAVLFAVGPSILALTRPATGNRVDFVVAAGGYYDINAAITFFTTGRYRDFSTGAMQWRAPDNRGKWAFVAGNLNRLAPPRDRTTLAAMAWRRANDPGADLADLAATLGPEGAIVFRLLNDPAPEHVPELLAALPETARRDLMMLDLSRLPLARLTSRFILIHGHDDPVVPASQSEALAAALPADRVELFLLDRFNHIDPQAAGWRDRLRLVSVVEAVLAQRIGPTHARP